VIASTVANTGFLHPKQAVHPKDFFEWPERKQAEPARHHIPQKTTGRTVARTQDEISKLFERVFGF
jgi:hypothetical protein